MIVNDNPNQFKNSLVKPQSFEKQVSAVDQLPDSDLQKIAKDRSNKQDFQRTVSTVTYKRDPYIAAYSKRRARSRCELCESEAPFLDNEGKPYLECHHILWLSEGGEDSIDNVVTLCSNCHRRIHVLNDSKDLEKLQNRLKMFL